jgi:hypothetical protein
MIYGMKNVETHEKGTVKAAADEFINPIGGSRD